MRHPLVAAFLLALAVVLLSGCGQKQDDTNPGPPVSAPVHEPTTGSQPTGSNPSQAPPAPQVPKGPYQPNEAGRVMVLMYHNIGYPEAEWTRTPENFRQDLELLYREGYRLVSLLDYVSNNINLPEGYAPVILTFDDATQGQFNLIEEDGKPVIDPNSAVGMIKAFAEEHPDFGTAATFYSYYPNPFRQPQYKAEKYRMLVEMGMDIGNHTVGHQKLADLSDDKVQEALARHVEETQKILPGYQVESLALPYGSRPKNQELAVTGEYNGVKYRNRAVLLVGSNPAPSPVVTKFDPAAIPRVRASDPYIGRWLDHFRQNPGDRYVSDGDPDTITIPENKLGDLDLERVKGKNVILYSGEPK